ncbi:MULTISPECIES: hypothetical protein [unclassified Sedimentibacter]|uniref:hypothetical protein n=1 Tax=unclassified Sedimentibacter TaxID=2649220 RepID=UPI001BD50A8C|nr:hypothetical protein [Sedimentibacter sp. MB35-C1]WMJ76132.1 hypothetical protein RBQ61_10900 [Sedimentibacter sp. MB35-C1]
MNNLIGYPLKDAIEIIEKDANKIISIKKITGTNKKFNNLEKPYVIRRHDYDNYVTLYISYY